MSSTTGQPRNRRYIRPSQQRKTKLCWPENSIEHQNVYGRRSSSSSASITYVSIRTSEAVRRRSSSSKQQCEYKHTCVVYTSEADFHKPGIYGGRVRVWANELDVFHCTPSRGGRVFGGISFFFSRFLSNAHGLLQVVRFNLASCTSLLVSRRGKIIPGNVDNTHTCRSATDFPSNKMSPWQRPAVLRPDKSSSRVLFPGHP